MINACYLDHNATTPLREEACDAMSRAMGVTGNASSVHGFGREQRKIVEDAREQVASLAGANRANVIFTSGGSEANNTLLRGIAATQVITSTIEHASVLDAVPDAKRIPVDANGVVDLDALKDQIEEGALISIMAANNETGVIQPIVEIAEIVHGNGAKLHVDAIQAAGKLPLGEITAVADAMSLSAHKLGGPAGVGAIVVRDGVPFEPLIKGGGQERRRRAGTENTVGIAGFGAASAAALRDMEHFSQIAELRDTVEKMLGNEAQIYGNNAERLANTTCMRMAGVSAETQVMAFDLAGVAVSAGSACSSGKVEPSHVLRAMGLSEQEAGEAIRVSFGWTNSKDDADKFIEAWRALRVRTASEAA